MISGCLSIIPTVLDIVNGDESNIIEILQKVSGGVSIIFLVILKFTYDNYD